MNQRYSTDILIFGGGIAGLWLLRRLLQEGWQAILIEKNQLGGGQTLASQGIVHGGLKFALGGNVGEATNRISAMPTRWRRCLSGEDAMDLRQVSVLSDHYYMWSAASFRSRLKSFLGSKSLQGRIEHIDRNQFPAPFAQPDAAGSLYRLPDFVIDPVSLIAELARGLESRIFQVDPAHVEFVRDGAGNYGGIVINPGANPIQLDCARLVFSAGEGNGELIARCKLTGIATQNRPLHMVYLEQEGLPPLFAHCIGDDFSMTPMLTVTTHQSQSGKTVWYLGGELAESGVDRSPADQISVAQTQLAHYFPWIDTAAATWSSFPINRAEARMPDGRRPDDAMLMHEANIIVAFPTKFTLTPGLADKLMDHLATAAIPNSKTDSSDALAAHLPAAEIGLPRWDGIDKGDI